MSTVSNKVDGVREVSERDAAALELAGRIKDLSRDNVIVHVGKPVGSISGWVGTFFWQVWTDRSDPAGTVRARIDEREAEVWSFDPAAEKAALLEQGKDRLIAQVQAEREASLAEAKVAAAALPVA